MTEHCPYLIIIPARFSSSRLPGKMLKDIQGKPMLQHVYEQAKKSLAHDVIIATDHDKIIQALKTFDSKVMMTSTDHLSGTERIAEILHKLNCSDDCIIVNLQGDLPLINPILLDQVAEALAAHPEASIATLAERISSYSSFLNPNHVKVVINKHGHALYFSRSPIPWQKSIKHDIGEKHFSSEGIYHHIGLYAYRAGYIKKYVEMETSPLENTENLEQLRALWNGDRIHVSLAKVASHPGVDTEEDLQHIRNVFLRGT